MFDSALHPNTELTDRRAHAGENSPHDAFADAVCSLIEAVYGPTVRDHVERCYPNPEHVFENARINDSTTESVPRAAEVLVYETIHASKVSLYEAYDQNPAERSVYGF